MLKTAFLSQSSEFSRLCAKTYTLFSVQPLCALCLCGSLLLRKNNHRDTEHTEVAQRRSRIETFRAKSVQPLGCRLAGKLKLELSTEDGSQFLYHDILIRIDADLTRDAKRFHCNFARGQVCILNQGTRGGQRVRAAGANRQHAFIRRDHITIARKKKRVLLISDDQQRLEVTQHLVCTPFLAELNRGTLKIAMILLELALESRQKRERIASCSRKAG